MQNLKKIGFVLTLMVCFVASARGFDSTTAVQHAGTGTLATALAACPATGNTPCLIIADPGQTYTVSSPLILGNNGYPQTLWVNGATINCTSTGADACIELTDQGRLVGSTYLKGTTNTGSLIKASSTSHLSAVVASESGPTGDAMTHFDVEDINIQGNTSATLDKAVLWISGICGLGTVKNVTISGIPAAGGSGILIDDSPNSASGCTNVMDLDTIWLALGNVAMAGNGLHITSAKSGTTDVECKSCSVVDSTGAGEMILIDTTGATLTNTVRFDNLYLEMKAGFTGDAFYDNNARNVTIDGLRMTHNGSPSFTNCLHIAGASLDSFRVTGRADGSVGCTNVIQNDINSTSQTTQGSFYYDYQKSGQGVATTFDGLGLRLANPPTGTTSPSLTSCGSGALSTGSNSYYGQITMTGVTSCTLTPGFTCANRVIAAVTDETTLGGAKAISAATTSTVITATSGDVVDYVAGCR